MRFLQKTLIASATVGAFTIGISFAQDVTSSQEVIPSDENIVPSEQAPQKIERMASESELDFLSRNAAEEFPQLTICLLYTSPSPRDKRQSRMPSSA